MRLARYGAAVQPNRVPGRVLIRFRREAVVCGQTIQVTIPLKNRAYVGCAQPRRRFQQRTEHGLQIKGGAAYDLEHVGSGSLLL
jgi:hypothetical protein